MSRPPRREAVAGPRGGKAIDQWRAPPTAQAGCPAYGEPIGAKKFLFPPFLRNLWRSNLYAPRTFGCEVSPLWGVGTAREDATVGG